MLKFSDKKIFLRSMFFLYLGLCIGEWIRYSLEAVVVEDTGADVVGRLTAAPKGVAEIEDIW